MGKREQFRDGALKNRWPSTHLRASNFQINQIGVSLFMEMETGVDRGQSTEDKFSPMLFFIYRKER
jgi:hypothetical protein